jgi:hypothetical protein
MFESINSSPLARGTLDGPTVDTHSKAFEYGEARAKRRRDNPFFRMRPEQFHMALQWIFHHSLCTMNPMGRNWKHQAGCSCGLQRMITEVLDEQK